MGALDRHDYRLAVTVSWWAWAVVLGVIGLLLTADLLSNRFGVTRGVRGALALSAAWITSAVLFGLVLGIWQGSSVAAQYFAGYLLEKALSVDNIFIFAVIFTSLEVPRDSQHRVLYYGVVGALALRAGFIAGGGALIEHISWTIYVFGAFLLLAGARMIRGTHVRPDRNIVLRVVQRTFPITSEFDGDHFFSRVNGKLVGTGLLMALITIETTDLVFATDSIPAIFGITRNLFVVFSSNAFAVLGLRALYFLLAEALDRFIYLSKGLALLLVLIGIKMLMSHVISIPTAASLGAIIVVLTASVLASVHRSPSGRLTPPLDSD